MNPITKEAVTLARALARRLFREVGEREARLAVRKIGKVSLKKVAEGLSTNVEKHILEHTDEVVEKAAHTLFRSGLTKEELMMWITETIKKGGTPVLSEMSENGKLAWVFEREFKDQIGADGQKILRVIVDKEGRVVTAFPVNSLLKRVAIRGIQVSGQLTAIALLTIIYETQAEAAEEDTSARYKRIENSKSWFETTLEWVGPYGIFESSPIGLEPNFTQIRGRTAEAISAAESELGRKLTTYEANLIRENIYNIWAESVTSYRP